ncbi:MAG: VWA domain-containing protein [Polyangia bacterium]|jgi:Ca-activated chloride channel family protein
MTIHSITFVHPVWLLVGLLFAVTILILGARLDRKRRLALAAFSSRRNGAASSLSRTRRGFKRALLVAGALLGCATLARPQWGIRWEEAQRRGLDLLFALDTSKSMLAPDLKPDRLTRAKLAIRDLVAKFDGDRVGLVAFAGDAFLQCPLTLDRGVFEQTLDALDTTTIFRGGTDVGRAIDVARSALHNQPANRKLLVFLTDGEDLESHAVQEARAAAADGIRIYTVGVGTPGGELIPLAGEPGQFARDDKGGFVRSQLDENTLQAIARVTGGDYRRLGLDGRGLEALYQDVLAKLPREDLHSRMHQIPIERFQWPLGFAILFLALEPLVGERRRRRVLEAEPEKRWPKLALLRRRVVVTLAIAAVTAVAQSANASPRDAERAYHAGKFKQSADEYGRALAHSPNDVKLQYNLGVAAYKSGEYAKAGDALGRSLHADRLDLQENAYYDLGNVLFRVGQETVAKQPEQTTEKWKKSIASYESALKLNPKDQDAIYNRDLVKRKLAALEQQQQKQKDEQKKKEDKSGQQNKQNQAGKQGQKDQQAKNEQGKQGQKDQQAKNEQGKQDQQKQQGQQGKQNEKGQPENQQASAQPQQGTGQPKPAATKPEQQAPGAASAGDESEKDQKEPEVPGELSKNDAKELLDAVRGDEKIMPMVPTGPNRPAADDVVRKDW